MKAIDFEFDASFNKSKKSWSFENTRFETTIWYESENSDELDPIITLVYLSVANQRAVNNVSLIILPGYVTKFVLKS